MKRKFLVDTEDYSKTEVDKFPKKLVELRGKKKERATLLVGEVPPRGKRKVFFKLQYIPDLTPVKSMSGEVRFSFQYKVYKNNITS